VNVPVFTVFFITLLLCMLILLTQLHRLPETIGVFVPISRGGFSLRPMRGVANLINLIDRSGEKTE
jgi:hypothetical protein